MTFDTFLLGTTHQIHDEGETIRVVTTFTASQFSSILAYVVNKHPEILAETKKKQAMELYNLLCPPSSI